MQERLLLSTLEMNLLWTDSLSEASNEIRATFKM